MHIIYFLVCSMIIFFPLPDINILYIAVVLGFMYVINLLENIYKNMTGKLD